MMVRAAILCLAAALAGCGSTRNDAASVREPDTASRLHVAATAAASGQTDIALSLYGAAAAAAPDNIEANAKYVGLLLKVGRPQDAEQALTKALARHSSDPTLLRWRGVLQLQMGDANGAMQVFDKLLARNKRDIAAMNGRGMALDMIDRHGEAEQAYRAALSLAPSDIQSANNLAISLLLSDRAAEARDLLLPLSQRPDAPQRVLNNLAVAQAAAGDAKALVSARPDSEDMRALATAFGAPPMADERAPSAPRARIGARPTG